MRAEVEFVSNYERITNYECQKLYTQGGVAYGSVRNKVKTINLAVSKVRQFLHKKPSYPNFAPATRTFKTMKAFARFKNEILWMHLADIDKLVKGNNDVK